MATKYEQNHDLPEELKGLPRQEHVFKAPEGYFEELPGMVQARIATPPKKAARWADVQLLRVAVPALLVLLAVGWFALRPGTEALPSADEYLAEASTEELLDYLEGESLTYEDLSILVSNETYYDSLLTEYLVVPEGYIDELDIDLTTEELSEYYL